FSYLDTPTTATSTLSLHDALPISLGRANVIVVTRRRAAVAESRALAGRIAARWPAAVVATVQLALDGLAGLRSGRRVALAALARSEEHTSELQSRSDLVCRLLLEK